MVKTLLPHGLICGETGITKFLAPDQVMAEKPGLKII
jgi:hypothetical protein